MYVFFITSSISFELLLGMLGITQLKLDMLHVLKVINLVKQNSRKLIITV